MHREAGHYHGSKYARIGKQENRNHVLTKVPKLNLQAAFEEQWGKENNEADIRSEPTRLPAKDVIHEGNVKGTERQPANHQGDGVRNAQTISDHRDCRSRNQHPDQKLDRDVRAHELPLARLVPLRAEASRHTPAIGTRCLIIPDG